MTTTLSLLKSLAETQFRKALTPSFENKKGKIFAWLAGEEMFKSVAMTLGFLFLIYVRYAHASCRGFEK